MALQVAGELSNAGLPMRRFMQTFILAPQSPKKYYVHNDIFRYQDEVFHDVATDSEPDAAGEFFYCLLSVQRKRLCVLLLVNLPTAQEAVCSIAC